MKVYLLKEVHHFPHEYDDREVGVFDSLDSAVVGAKKNITEEYARFYSVEYYDSPVKRSYSQDKNEWDIARVQTEFEDEWISYYAVEYEVQGGVEA